MAIITFFGITPGTVLGQAQVASNMVAIRDALRAAGRAANLTQIVSGGVPGAMGLSMEVPDWDAWATQQTEGMPASVQEVNSKLPPSGGIGQGISTMMELPGLETPTDSIPRNIVGNSRIKVHPGKETFAYDMVAKSKEILTRLGATVRVMGSVHTMETGYILFSNFFESPQAMVQSFAKIGEDAEWQAHWNNAARIGNMEVVSQSVWSFVP